MISVVLSTVNRAEILRRTLEAMSDLRSPVGDWQLLVIDNGSTDHTQDVIASFRTCLPLASFQHCKPGKNAALNSVISHFQGDLIVFTDDDVLPHPDWLAQHRRLADNLPEYDAFGGRIELVWPEQAPDWIIRNVPRDVCFGETPANWPDGPCVPGQLWGANMSIRAKVFEKGHSFDPNWGPKFGNNRYLTGGETNFVSRIHAAGHRCYYNPAPAVGHIIRPEQLDYRWIMARGFRSGRLQAINLGLASAVTRRSRLVAWLRWLKMELRCEAYTRRAALSGSEPWRVARDWKLNMDRGMAYQRPQPPVPN
jgi:glycosyltransferase involved in cell wall biosynthesis